MAFGRAPVPLLFVLSAVSQYGGASVAVGLFVVLPAASVAWARVASSALVLTAIRRPWRLRWPARPWLLSVGFGLVLAGMNIMFYEAIDRLPLGTAVAIEFTGPVLVAVIGARRWRDAGALLLAAAGVLALADVSWSASPAGVLFALAAALLWAGYILLGKRVAAEGAGIDGLTVGLLAATVLLAPVLLPAMAPVLHRPWLIALCLALGVLSTAVPYGIDQLILRRIPAARFALMQSLLPATAAIIGALVLRQIPGLVEIAGILAVGGAVAIASSGQPGE